MNRNAVAGLAIVCLITGAVSIALYASGQASASRGRDWTQVLGTIDAVTPEAVTYRYEVNERAHTVTDNQAQSGRYRQGQRVLIYVNPANPAESLLELGRRPNPWTAAAGALFLLTAAALGGFALTLRKSVGVTANANGIGERTHPGKPARGNAPPLSRLRPPPSIPRKAPDDDTTVNPAADAK